MLRPCKTCPFRQDLQLPFPLGRDRRAAIADSLLHDASFGCHGTTTFDYKGQHVWSGKERPCIGAARLIEKELGDCRANVMFRLDARFGKLDVEAIDRSVPVLDTVDAFVNEVDGKSPFVLRRG